MTPGQTLLAVAIGGFVAGLVVAFILFALLPGDPLDRGR